MKKHFIIPYIKVSDIGSAPLLAGSDGATPQITKDIQGGKITTPEGIAAKTVIRFRWD